MWVVNALGSGIGEREETWGFTVDVTMFTYGKLDSVRLQGLANLAQDTADRVISNSGLHNPTFDTTGAELDRRAQFSDSEGFGIYWANVAIDDVQIGAGDYRLGYDIDTINVELLDKMDDEGYLQYRGEENASWLSRLVKRIEKIVSPLIGKPISEGLLRRRRRKGRARHAKAARKKIRSIRRKSKKKVSKGRTLRGRRQ